jgi:glycerophosphoryl diester phosphodiesterase
MEQKEANSETAVKAVILQGHRGCRGELPENTIEAFLRAVDAGVSTLEMDVVLTGDRDVLVSHDPWISQEIMIMPNGEKIDPATQHELNIFEMSTDSCQTYVCGSKRHKNFPEQKQVKSFKPTLKQAVEAVRDHCRKKNLPVPSFDIEVKSTLAWEGKYHPSPESYASIFLREFLTLSIAHMSTVQSFDHRILNSIHKQYPELDLIYLSEREREISEMLTTLNFKPYGISLDYKLWTDQKVKECKDQGLHMTAWTVNTEVEMNALLTMGVRDIITDYPTMMVKALKKQGIEVYNRATSTEESL